MGNYEMETLCPITYLYHRDDKDGVFYIEENSPDNFKIESTSLWSFPKRGKWSTHNGSYRGNWSPYIPRNIILRYSREGDIVLDQFLGSGTTLIEAALLKRNGIGIDINLQALELSRRNTNTLTNENAELIIKQGNACNLAFINNNSIDLICTHPPYSNIIRYSENTDGDLSHLDIDDFLVSMKHVATECFRVLKKDKYCAILMGDTRRKKHIIPLGFRVMDTFIDSGFALKEIIIKEQHNCKSHEYWCSRSIEQNFLLIAHEYLFVFRKP
jgi:DNA modification methylase